MQIQEDVSFHASLVVLPVDDFTGKPVKGSKVRIFIPGQKPPLRKADGYYVFINITEPNVTLYCESGLYHPRAEEICFEGASKPLVYKLRLSPNVSYPVPAGATCVTGRAVPKKQVRFWCMDGDGAYKLLYGYQRAVGNGSYIRLYNPEHRELADKAFFIQDREKKKQEYFTVAETEEEGMCRLTEPLQHDYKKAGTVIYPVYDTFANEKGDFFLLIGSCGSGENTWLWEMEGEKEAKKVILKPGQINSLLWKEEM